MVKTSIQVQFGGDQAGKHVSVEVDDRPEGLNAGKTSFAPGETVWLLLYCGVGVTIDCILTSAGSVVQPPSYVGVVQKEEDVTFDDGDVATLSYPATSITDVQWLGNQLGSLSLQPGGLSVRAQRKGVAVARVKYNTAPIAKGVQSPASMGGVVDFPINVIIKATAQ